MPENPSFWLTLPRNLVVEKLREFLAPGEEGIIGAYLKELIGNIESSHEPLTAYGMNWVLQTCANSLGRHAPIARKFQYTIVLALSNIDHPDASEFAEGVKRASEDRPTSSRKLG